MIYQKVLACFPSNFKSLFLMIIESAGSIMKTCFPKKKLLECMKDPIFLQIFLLSLSKSAILKNFIVASKKLVGTLANDIYSQPAKFEKILLSNMEDIYVLAI